MTHNNKILKEEITDKIPYWNRIRDFLVTDTVKNLFLLRHGETYFNLENRIGGDSPLTENGMNQARRLARYFAETSIPVIFTSEKNGLFRQRFPSRLHRKVVSSFLKEFNEIDSGICECMTYDEIRENMPHVSLARKKDKYKYVYPGREGYVSMKYRVDMGIKKALYLSLSHFLYRREEDVPYIYVPQDRFYHVRASAKNKSTILLVL